MNSGSWGDGLDPTPPSAKEVSKVRIRVVKQANNQVSMSVSSERSPPIPPVVLYGLTKDVVHKRCREALDDIALRRAGQHALLPGFPN